MCKLSPILYVEVIVLYTRIRKAREDLGYTREQFAEKLDVSVSYLAELERGRTGISVKTLIKVCDILGLSADYVLFGEPRNADQLLLDKISRLDDKYLPLIERMITELLALSEEKN
jgi:transcriptional regulator with XRE-family HTH domain